MIRRPPRSTLSSSSAASDVYKRQESDRARERGARVIHRDQVFEHNAHLVVQQHLRPGVAHQAPHHHRRPQVSDVPLKSLTYRRSGTARMRLVLFAVTLALSVGAAPVRVGLQTLADQGFSLLLGKRVVVFANPTAVHPSSLLHLVDLLAAHPNITVAGVLAPEHGFRGDLQAEHGDPPSYIDNSTGLRVYSAYRRNGSELAAVLGHLEAQLVISDFQDVGTRLYTFMWTLVDVLGAVQIHGCHMVLLDRPNPLGGITVSGPTLNLTQVPASRYGTVSGITHRHGMTVAELSLYALGQEQPAWLTVYPVTGWSRSMHWADTCLLYTSPSPRDRTRSRMPSSA
eukprot:TRINITY_DN13594_c0_g1_i2.p1 TRINITY_DN13594_c0_g1~~TRINITY_DN13594_c0_g1_i2.p1  ORF type:complete len:342 (-),score=54.68 TRINITY_DN13594_c0_g1_i2:34-1059(-)